MAASSGQFHEDESALSTAVKDRHRAIVSLMEELEAVDWYDQRIEATTDEELAGILRHNRDEEKEHASMLLEWLRRRDPTWEAHLREYLFTETPIADREAAAAAPVARRDLGVGAVRDKEVL